MYTLLYLKKETYIISFHLLYLEKRRRSTMTSIRSFRRIPLQLMRIDPLARSSKLIDVFNYFVDDQIIAFLVLALAHNTFFNIFSESFFPLTRIIGAVITLIAKLGFYMWVYLNMYIRDPLLLIYVWVQICINVRVDVCACRNECVYVNMYLYTGEY